MTAGSGITPVMGMLRSHSRELGDVVVVHSAPTADDVVFGDELRKLGATASVRLVERHTATSARLTAAELDALVPDWADRQTWACGPADLLDDIEAHWARHGLADRLHTERFTMAGSAAATVARSASPGPGRRRHRLGDNASGGR